ncbi:MAG: hypothetical protein EA383_01530 [Spirochaetaceae bacterium]|nr:MAG: hypothetical protein EA383_01530 [Spirochaetaceae bacterium]
MTKDAIINEIRKRPLEEQREIIAAIELSSTDDAELTAEDIAVVDARVRHMEAHPETPLNERDLWSRVRKQA